MAEIGALPFPAEESASRFTLRSFALCALYAFALMSLYRLFVLPIFEPTMTDGILPGDPLMFHREAVRIAEEIRSIGWAQWSLRPDGAGNVGVLAALYALFGPLPQISLVLNALLHGVAGAALIAFAMQFVPRRYAVLVALPFILSPYQMEWYSQPTKDSFAAAGAMLVMLGWSIALRGWAVAKPQSRFWHGVLTVGIGLGLISIVRPYLVQILIVLSVPVVILLLAATFSRAPRRAAMRRVALQRIGILVLAAATLLPLAHFATDNAVSRNVAHAEQATAGSAADTFDTWHRAAWLPSKVDYTIYAIAVVQRRTYRPLAEDKNETSRAALIDIDHSFPDVSAVFAYLPRAAQIGVLAPFPNDWAIAGLPSKSVFRNFATLEMLLVYVSLPLLVLGVFDARSSGDYRVAAWLSFGVIVLYALATPHLGVLDRYRYPFLMVLLTLGSIHAVRLLVPGAARTLAANVRFGDQDMRA